MESIHLALILYYKLQPFCKIHMERDLLMKILIKVGKTLATVEPASVSVARKSWMTVS